MTESTNSRTSAGDFLDRAFARPHVDGEDPAVSSARRILEECEATSPREYDDAEIWERYGALQAAVRGLLDLIRGTASDDEPELYVADAGHSSGSEEDFLRVLGLGAMLLPKREEDQ